MSIMRVTGKEHLSREEQMRIEGELEIHLAFPSFAWLSKLFQVCSVLCFFLVILLKDNTIILESSSTSDEFYDFPLICLRNASCPLNSRPVFAPSPSHTTETFFSFWPLSGGLFHSPSPRSYSKFTIHLVNTFGHITFCFTSFWSYLLYKVLSKTSLTVKTSRVTL